MDERARLTLPDVVYLLVSFGFVAALWPVAADLLDSHPGQFGPPGTELLVSMMLPLMVLVMLYLLFAKASLGAP